MKNIYPGYTTTGIVVESYSEKKENIDRVKVRIYELHGASSDYVPVDTTISEDFTPDSDLPWIKVTIPAGFSLSSKTLIYSVGTVVYVQFSSDNPEDSLVVGLAMSDNHYNAGYVQGYYNYMNSQGLSGNTGNGGQAPGTSTSITVNGVGDSSLFWNPLVDSVGNPVDGFEFRSPFTDNRTDLAGSKYSDHRGVDLGSANGSYGLEVYASRDGTVCFAGVNGDYGNCVIIEHKVSGETYYTLYAHLSQINVTKGQTVKGIVSSSGSNTTHPQTIGEVGSSGNVTGPHLHFEIRKGENSRSAAVDPTDYIDFNRRAGTSSGSSSSGGGYGPTPGTV